MIGLTILLFVKAQRSREHAPEAPEDGADDYTWLFLVPALNEAVTIHDSVARLLALPLAHRHIVVIDDGSDDGTSEALAEIDAPDLHVLRREPPDARKGKAAALNHAYRASHELLEGLDRARVIAVVIDADGRLDVDAPRFVAPHFAEDERLGGVQSLVRIYNRHRLLTWLQDVEFSVYGFLYQAGRTPWGTAGMGGNGQFNRLSALDSVADHEGPWRDRLTEDQDLGLRLLGAGWHGRQELRAAVDQQGLPGLRRLLRQRTRWSQGNLQAMGLIGVVWRARISLLARLDLLSYLLMPLWQTIVGASLIVAIVLAILGVAPFWGDLAWWQLLFFYVLGFGGVLMGCIARGAGQGLGGVLRNVLVAQVYAFYSWLLWPVLVRATARQLTDRRGWAKTEREALRGAEEPPPRPAARA
jgi:cellulose synthase/poly-beta-1,6-N-acetylglucosamine synthase-like glycosyltransferase